MAFNVVDTYFIGQLGAAELAAMGFIGPIVVAVFSISVGISMGAGAALSRALGSGDEEQAHSIASNGILLSILVSILVSTLGITFNDYIFTLLGAKSSDLVLIWQYMGVWWPGVFLLIVPMVALGQMRAMGRTGLQSRIMIYASIINAVLDPILIMGFYNIPAFGIQGAAMATVMTRFVTLITALYYIKFDFDMLHLNSTIFVTFKTNCKSILHIAIPATLSNMIIPFAAGVLTAMIATYGTNAVAAMGIANTVEAICRVMLFALSAALGPVMGQNFGAGKYDRLKQACHYSVIFCIGWGFFIAAIIAICAENIASFFNDTPEVIEIAKLYLYIVPISFGFFGVLRMITAGFNAIGRPFPGTAISIIRAIVIQIPVAIYAGNIWGPTGIFAAIAVSNFLGAAVAYIWNRRIFTRL